MVFIILLPLHLHQRHRGCHQQPKGTSQHRRTPKLPSATVCARKPVGIRTLRLPVGLLGGTCWYSWVVVDTSVLVGISGYYYTRAIASTSLEALGISKETILDDIEQGNEKGTLTKRSELEPTPDLVHISPLSCPQQSSQYAVSTSFISIESQVILSRVSS